ncbi:MAG: acyltransferase [Acidobacteriia bacterium]|nr:acyltransferase [Terriglobia bacterium]
MIVKLLFRAARRLLEKWEFSVATRYRRARLILDCHFHGVELELGRNVHFHHPVRVWGVGGKLVIEDDVWFAFYGGNRCLGPIHLQLRTPGAELRIGHNVWLMPAIQIVCFERITIGPEAMFGFGCSMIDSDVHDFSPEGGVRPGKTAPVKVGQGARICPETAILKGVTVGEHAVVGNKSVVQGNLPPRCVAAGNPARVFLQYKDPEPATPKSDAVVVP